MSIRTVGRLSVLLVVLIVVVAGALLASQGLLASVLQRPTAGLMQAVSAGGKDHSATYFTSIPTGASGLAVTARASSDVSQADQTDTDGDGVSDADEYANYTDPNKADTDGDGFNDLEEIEAGSDPTDAADGGSAAVTVYAASSADRDGDGLPDEWEMAYDLDSSSASGIQGADGDPDEDQVSNYESDKAGRTDR